MTALLQVDAITKRFRGLTALTRVSFDVVRGELLLVIGPNGAGKTTLFNVITGFAAPEEGRVLLDGQSITGFAPHRIVGRGLARTFQIPRPFKSLTVAETVELARPSQAGTISRALGGSRRGISQQVLENVELWERRNEAASTLSQGDLKLLEVERALATNPAVLLLDEPYAGLGPTEMTRLTRVIVELHKAGLTLVIIEHKLRELMQIAQRVVVLNYGEKIGDGPPGEVSRDPRVLQAYMSGHKAAQHA